MPKFKKGDRVRVRWTAISREVRIIQENTPDGGYILLHDWGNGKYLPGSLTWYDEELEHAYTPFEQLVHEVLDAKVQER